MLALKWLLALASGHIMLHENGHFSEKITQAVRDERQERPRSYAGGDCSRAEQTLQRRAPGIRWMECQLCGPAHCLACGRSHLGDRRSPIVIYWYCSPMQAYSMSETTCGHKTLWNLWADLWNGDQTFAEKTLTPLTIEPYQACVFLIDSIHPTLHHTHQRGGA